jgi:hypothetical protein
MVINFTDIFYNQKKVQQSNNKLHLLLFLIEKISNAFAIINNM